jgi:carbon storage regulator
MLILSRKTDQSIAIGDHVKITVVAIQEGQVKLGIEAPQETKIYRTEIYEQIQQQNAAAAKSEKISAVKAARLLSTTSRPPAAAKHGP